MSETLLKQFVPSEVCLKCDGCCRYKSADSIWRPKLGQGDRENLGTLINAQDTLDSEGYIKTIQSCGEHFCRFLNSKDNTCGIYTKRPFECSLYPFIISQESDALKVYVHLSCPYIQDHLPKDEYQKYVTYLKEFFDQPKTRAFLILNRSSFHDYGPYAPELLFLFDLSL